jgi:protein O-mannosyl-transferase
MRYWPLAFFVLAALCFTLYWPALHGPFVFDDYPNLAALDSITHVSSWRDVGVYLSQARSFPGRPLAMLSLLLQKPAWPDHPFPFKLVNLLIHLVNGLLVARLSFVLARQYFGTSTHIENAGPRAVLVSYLAAAAFLLNPIQLSPILEVVQRMTLLMALFTLVGLLAYLHAVLGRGLSAPRQALWMFVGLAVCTMLAFLSKENGVLLPLYALVLDATLLRRQISALPKPIAWLRKCLIWPPVLLIILGLLAVIPTAVHSEYIRDFTLQQRLLTEPRILADYVGKIFLPRFGMYGLYNDGFTASSSFASPPSTMLSILGVMIAIATAFAARRRWPLLSMALLWYIGGQLIESSTVLLELYFEHRNYVPVIGPFIALTIGIVGLQPAARQQLALSAAILWLVACSIATVLSTRIWGSEERLAVAWANQYPNSVRARILLMDMLYEHGQAAKALDLAKSTLSEHPKNTGVADLVVYLQCINGTLSDKDVTALQALLRTAPFDRAGFGNIDKLRTLANAHKCSALTINTVKDIANAALDNPSFAHDSIASGFLHYQLHNIAVDTGDLNSAITQLDAVYATDPDAEVPRLQAKYLASAGLYDQAIHVLQQTDYSKLPLLRRLLVDDRAINIADIRILEQQKANHAGPVAGPNPPATH